MVYDHVIDNPKENDEIGIRGFDCILFDEDEGGREEKYSLIILIY